VLWLASYPRSGNTFARVVLGKVYGLDSSSFHDFRQLNNPRFLKYPVVKTHFLPDDLHPADPSIPAVYIVRDGRDSVVSYAHYQRDVLGSEAGFRRSLRRIICASGRGYGAYFGNWSQHVRLWKKRAAIVLKFEDLLADPIGTVEKVRAVYPLPAPRTDQTPSFDELRTRPFEFGPESTWTKDPKFRRSFFRRGQVGSWRDEMGLLDRFLFYVYHGRTLRELGYADTMLPRLPARARVPARA
jgi:hypothetical protein